jgi:hypothetical protein
MIDIGTQTAHWRTGSAEDGEVARDLRAAASFAMGCSLRTWPWKKG